MSKKNKKETHTDTTGLTKTKTELNHPILLKRQTNQSTVYFARIAVTTLTDVKPLNTQNHSRNSIAPNITHAMLV